MPHCGVEVVSTRKRPDEGQHSTIKIQPFAWHGATRTDGLQTRASSSSWVCGEPPLACLLGLASWVCRTATFTRGYLDTSEVGTMKPMQKAHGISFDR